jgi:hypothetical protein
MGYGTEKLGFPGGGAAASDIYTAGAGFITQQHSAAGGGKFILSMAQTKAAHLHNSDFFHGGSFLIALQLYTEPC